MARKLWEAAEMAFYLTAVILLLAYALAGSFDPAGWNP